MPVKSAHPIGRVLLLSNYAPDKQFSMRRFTKQLKQGLKAEGLAVEVYRPKVIVGKLGAKPSGFGKWLGYVDKYLLAPLHLRMKRRSLPENSVVHICDHSNAIYTKALQGVPHLVTCHDLLAVRSALGEIPHNRPKRTGRLQQSMILKGLKRSRMIASVSEATRQDVARIVGDCGDWQHLVPNALDDAFVEEAKSPGLSAPPPSPALAGLPAGSRYVMHIGGEKWYKNRKAVLQIYSQLLAEAADLRLVIVGPEFPEAVLQASGCGEAKDRIHYAPGICDEDLRALYRDAELLLFPSLMEGFGWPILEAQACGCPVATLGIEPMRSLNAAPELVAEVETTDRAGIDRMVELCHRQLHLPTPARAMQAQRMKDFAAAFTNQASAKAYLELYQELLGATSPR